MMQLRQIEYFLTLCEELHFTRAAKRCHVSQPSLTNAIMALEAQLRGPLFYRKPTVRLTVLGESVRPHLMRVRVGVDGALDAARSLQGLVEHEDIPVDARATSAASQEMLPADTAIPSTFAAE